MLGKKEREAPRVSKSATDTVLGPGAQLTGDLVVGGSVRVDGYLKGNLRAEGALTVGQGGRIEGDVAVQDAYIAGKVQGKIEARGKVELKASAEVQGDITCSALVIEEGALFNGQCHMSRGNERASGA